MFFTFGMKNEFNMDNEIDNERDFPRALRCSDGAEIPETLKNWAKALQDLESFQNRYIERVKRWIGNDKRNY